MKTRTLEPPTKNLVHARPGRPIEIARRASTIGGVKKILVPYDFSSESAHALAYAVAFAQQFDAEICVLSVTDDRPTTFERGDSEYESMIETNRVDRQKRLEQVLKEQVPAGLRTRALTARGITFERIVQTAHERANDLIVIATRRPDTRGEIGSTTQRVVCHAGCPVLVVRFPEHEFVKVIQSNRFPAASRDAEVVTDLGDGKQPGRKEREL